MVKDGEAFEGRKWAGLTEEKLFSQCWMAERNIK